MRRSFRSESGQSSTEYMLTISVVVIAVVAAAYTFVPTFKGGVQDLALDVQSILDGGKIGGVGLARDEHPGGGTRGSSDGGGTPATDTATE